LSSGCDSHGFYSNVVLRVEPRIVNPFTVYLILRFFILIAPGFVALLSQNFPQESLNTGTSFTIESLEKIGELVSFVLPFNYNTS